MGVISMNDAVPMNNERDGRDNNHHVVSESSNPISSHQSPGRPSLLQTIRAQPREFFWSLYAVFILVISSFDNQAGGVILGIPQFRKQFGKPYNGNYVLPAKWQSAYSGAPVLSSTIGYLGSSWLADRIGRKWTYAIGYVLVFTAITIETVATTNPVFFAGKFVAGFAIGTFTTTTLTYMAEIAPSQIRAVLITTSGLALSFGPFVVTLIVKGTGDQDNAWAYRSTFLGQYGFSVVGALLLPWLPESPWWLLSKDDRAAAAVSLSKFGYDERRANERIEVILKGLRQARRQTKGAAFVECFQGTNLRRTIIAAAPLSIQALSGLFFVASYSTYYQQLAGYSTSASFNLSIVQQLLNMFGSVCSWFLIDRLGRRPLSVFGMMSLTVILTLTGGLACVGSKSATRGTVALFLLYNWTYAITIGATAYPILTETPTSRLRAKTTSIGLTVQDLIFAMWAFVIPYLFNPDQANLGAKVAFIFGAFSGLSTLYLWFNQPETCGRSYEELDEMFLMRVPSKTFKAYRTGADTNLELDVIERA